MVSNLDDEDPYDVVDFKVGSRRHHRAIAAVAEVSERCRHIVVSCGIPRASVVNVLATKKRIIRTYGLNSIKSFCDSLVGLENSITSIRPWLLLRRWWKKVDALGIHLSAL